MINTAVIMAAGYGTRLFPITKYIPKPLIEINGQSLIKHCIKELKKNQIKNIYVTCGYKYNLIISEIFDDIKGIINTTDQENAYFLSNSLIKETNEKIIVLPADILFQININEAIKETKKDKQYIIPIVFRNGMDSDFITTSRNNKIKTIDRKNISQYCASGIQIINPFQINKIIKTETNWYNVWQKLIEENKLYSTNFILNKWKTFDTTDQILNYYAKTKDIN